MTAVLPGTFALALGGYMLDAWFGDPRRFHPVAGFGRYATWVEARVRNMWGARRLLRGAGVLAWLLAVVPPVAVVAVLAHGPAAALVAVLSLFFALGCKSLAQHGLAVAQALATGDLPAARRHVAMIVSRDTRALDAEGVARATVESMLENGSDAVFAALFWFVVAGAPGVVLYRLANTLDAMWGYRNERYRDFGWAAARLDDVLNYVPARLTALTYGLLGKTRLALACWRSQAPHWDSPNAGPVMAAGAGALGLRLGGPAIYFGRVETRPALGAGKAPSAPDIGRAIALVRRGAVAWLVLLGLAEWILRGHV